MKLKTVIFGLISIILGWCVEICHAGVSISVNDKHKSILENGNISIPVEIDNIENIKAFSLTVSYEGEFTGVEFKPSDYLHEPLVLPLKIDKENSTITIMCSATDKIITREMSGVIGNLIFDKDANISLFEIDKAEYINEGYKLVSIISSASPAHPMLSEESTNEKVEVYENNLYNAYPNPANPLTTISFSVRQLSRVSLKIFNVTGQLIKILVKREMDKGRYSIDWDAKDREGNIVASGIYFYRIEIGDYSSTKKLVILK